jgi:hypothetical protein
MAWTQKDEDRFWSKVEKSAGCWNWAGTVLANGYGQFWLAGRAYGPHRLAYELIIGKIATGLEIDHLCRNPRCVRPDHLEAVTHRENWARSETYSAIAFKRDHCSEGHLYAEHGYTATSRGRPYRGCRLCKRRLNREWIRTARAS